MEKVVNVASDMTTFLSPNVHHIIVETRLNSKLASSARSACTYVTENWTFNWQEIETSLNISDDIHIHNQPADWFPEVIQKMWPICDEAYTTLTNISPEDMKHFWELCKWTGKEKDLKDFYEDFRSLNETSTVETILFVTSVLERSLGNVYLLKGKTVPFLLRDLLATSELTSILGRIPTMFLQLLVGTPAAFNVRNLAWHGFPRPDELCPSLAATLFIMVASVGQLLPVKHTSLPRRPPATDLAQLAEQMAPPPAVIVPQGVLPALTDSSLVPSPYIAYWRSALQYYHRGRWGHCCLVALPQLEHLARVAYCCAHNCPSRLLTAESSVRYLTLDDLLDASDTSMLSLLGEGLLQLLRDLLSLPAGPRLRDRLSHGEVDLADIPYHLAGHFLGAAAAIALRFRPGTSQPYNNYISRFHNIAILKTAIFQTVKDFEKWKQCPRPPEIPWPDWNVLATINEDLYSLHHKLMSCIREAVMGNQQMTDDEKWDESECVINITNILKIFLSNIHIPTLPVPKTVAEVISLFRLVIQNIEIVSRNVTYNLETKAHQLATRKLRSRQRLTYTHFLSTVPLLEAVLKCVVVIVAVHLLHVMSSYAILEVHRTTYIRFLKLVLQFVELVASGSSPEKNRWEEVSNLAKHFCQQVVGNRHLIPALHTNENT